jgi:hypothetical protein
MPGLLCFSEQPLGGETDALMDKLKRLQWIPRFPGDLLQRLGFYGSFGHE